MTSFTRKLDARDPAAAAAIRYGKSATLVCFTPLHHGLVPSFGKRLPSGSQGCETNCRHPACTHGCTLVSRNGGSR